MFYKNVKSCGDLFLQFAVVLSEQRDQAPVINEPLLHAAARAFKAWQGPTKLTVPF